MTSAQPSEERGLSLVVLYLTLTVAICCLWWWLISVRGGFGTYYTWLMWSPAIAAVITLKSRGHKLDGLGFRGTDLRFLISAALSPLLYLLPAFALAWWLNLETFETREKLGEYATNLGFEGATGVSVVIGYAFVSGLASIIQASANALGEEIGWRGFLFPRLAQKFGFIVGTLATGVIWALWHFPLPLLRPDYVADAETVFGLAGFTASIVLSSFVYSYFRLRTGSVWTAALVHGGHNALLGMLGRLTLDAEHAGPIYYYVGEEGVLTFVFALLTAIMFWWLYRRDKRAGRLVLDY